MIRPDKIKSSLYGGVGFHQSPITEYAIVDADNLASESGLFFQDASGLVTIQNIKQSQQAIEISDVNFNTYLKQLQESCIIEVCRRVTAGQSDFVQDKNIYPYQKSFKNTIDSNGKFVGFIIESVKNLNVISKISSIEVCFNEAVTFNVYLYNSNKPNSPIQTKEVTTLANESVVVDLGWFISDEDEYKGGSFYLGYFQDDLGTAKAIKKDYDLANLQVSTPCLYIQPMSLDNSGTVIDVESIVNESDIYGLNMIVSTYNDYTELIIRNKNLFWGSIQLQMAEKVLNIIKSSIRSNATTNSLSIDIRDVQFELYGSVKDDIDGLLTSLKIAVTDVKKTLFRRSVISKGTLR
jgi:hypothetical protein